MISTKNLVSFNLISFNLTIYLIGLKIFKKDINEFNKKRDLIISILISCLYIHNIKLVYISFILRHYYNVYNLSPISINILDSVSWSLLGNILGNKSNPYNIFIIPIFIIPIEILRLYILSYFVWIEYDTKRKARLPRRNMAQPGCDVTEILDLSPVKKENHKKTKLEYIFSILSSTLTPESNKTKKDIKYY